MGESSWTHLFYFKYNGPKQPIAQIKSPSKMHFLDTPHRSFQFFYLY